MDTFARSLVWSLLNRQWKRSKGNKKNGKSCGSGGCQNIWTGLRTLGHWAGAEGTRELDANELSRAAYLMLDWCGLTRCPKSERACVFSTSEQHLLDIS